MRGAHALAKPGVVVVGRILTLDRSRLIDKIGTLSDGRIAQIVSGLKLVFEPRSL